MSDSETNELLAIARRTPSNLRYFFERLDDPGWISVLEREGFFASPAPVERTEDDEGTWLRFPDWPASRYLVRVADAAPERVAQVLLSLPETDNVRVHEDIVDAALQMPAEWAGRLAERELSWFASSTGPLLNYPLRLVELALLLLQAGRHESAIAIFNAVLKLHQAESPSSSRKRAAARLSEWQYRTALEKIWPALLKHEGSNGLRFLADKLQGAAELSMRENGHDLSYLWRPAIEAHVQNVRGSLFDELVDAIRDMALAAAARDPEGALRVLEEFEPPIFARLRLHVLRVVGERAPEATAEALLDRRNLEDLDVWHEYAELLRARFSQLDEAQQAQLLAMIRQGSADESADQTEEGEVHRADRRYKRLAVIADLLQGEARADYEQLVARFGSPDHPEFLAHSTSWTGPISPLSADELRRRSPAELIAFFEEWQPESTLGPHSTPEGLGRILSEIVAAEPEPYASEALRFVGSDPTYVRSLLTGLEQAAKAGRTFSWDQPVQLAKWAIEQPDIAQPGRCYLERDSDWSWTRKQIARLLGRGLEAGAASLPAEHREVVWSLLSKLAQDPEPAPSLEGEDDGMDPATRSLNVTRGEAMHSVMRYTMWVERLEGDAFQGLASVPEARVVLERHLDPDAEPSPAVRAVYGMWLAQLVRMDEGWVVDHIQVILPTDIAKARLFAAVWDAYIVFTRPWLGVYQVLEQAYGLAVERLPEEPLESGLAGRPDESLAEHLVWYAVMSAIPIEGAGVWNALWDRASGSLRRHAVAHLGQMFQHKTDAPAEVRQRVEELWSWIAAHVEGEQRPQTLAPFGWLLSTKALDDRWLLEQALGLLEEGIHLEPDFTVWEALGRTVDTYPAASAGVLRMMIQTDPHGWAVLGAEESVRQILEGALESDDPDAHRRARDAINLLGARGMHTFRDIAEKFTE